MSWDLKGALLLVRLHCSLGRGSSNSLPLRESGSSPQIWNSLGWSHVYCSWRQVVNLFCTTRRIIKQVAEMVITWQEQIITNCSHLGSMLASVSFQSRASPCVLTASMKWKALCFSSPLTCSLSSQLFGISLRKIYEKEQEFVERPYFEFLQLTKTPLLNLRGAQFPNRNNHYKYYLSHWVMVLRVCVCFR